MSKILIVEDETNLRNTLTDLLEMFDYEVVAGVDGEDGLEKALTENVDLILCDINMPKMDGFEMLENLTKKMQKEIIPPFIFLSAKIAREDIRRGMKLGATDYITKPFTNQEILDTIESKLDYRSQLQSNISDEIGRAHV